MNTSLRVRVSSDFVPTPQSPKQRSSVSKLMKKIHPLLVAVIAAATINTATADNWFDVNGTTAGFGTPTGSPYSWESALWATASGGTTATGNFVSGSFARFNGTGAYTVNLTASE